MDYQILLKTLEEEIVQYKKLYELLYKEVDLVTDLDSKALSINTAKKMHVLSRIAKLNEKREFFLTQVNNDLPENKKSSNLRDITKSAPPELRKKFDTCREEFLELARKVKEKNIYNKEYLGLSLSRIKGITGTIFKHVNKEPTYNHKGRMPSGDGGGKYPLMNREA
jgi:hypothetical protein